MTPTPIFIFEKEIECVDKLVPVIGRVLREEVTAEGLLGRMDIHQSIANECGEMTPKYAEFALKENFGSKTTSFKVGGLAVYFSYFSAIHLLSAKAG